MTCTFFVGQTVAVIEDFAHLGVAKGDAFTVEAIEAGHFITPGGNRIDSVGLKTSPHPWGCSFVASSLFRPLTDISGLQRIAKTGKIDGGARDPLLPLPRKRERVI